MKNTFKTLGATAAALALAGGSAFATDPDVAGIATAGGALLTAIYPIVLGAVSFGILISIVKMVKRK